MNSTDVRSASGAQLRFHAILLPFTSRRIKQWIDEGDLGRIQIAVLQGIEVARTLGCGVVSLGQYTSIVTLNGTSVRPHDLGVTTGNSYAIALALQALEKAHADRGVDPAASTLAIVGASGNIGRTCAEILAPRYRKLILVGSGKPGALFRLAEFAKTIPNAEIATEPSAVRPAHVILAATNAVNTPLRSEHIGRNAIVCDLSVPATLARDTFERFDLLAIKGGVARLPHGEDLEIAGFPLPAGQAYGCMAEGMLLGFEDVRDTEFTGSLTAVHVERVTAMAAKHGFRLADYKTECVLGSEAHASH